MPGRTPHVAVTSTATKIADHDATGVTRVVQNLGSKECYVSDDPAPVASDTTSGNGIRITAGGSESFDSGDALYAICNAGESTVVAVATEDN